ncbi:MAG: dienelactone hydrolase family protein [Paracoccaceae bacterium]|nr:dienelactone hydrolase family protein [Paracoccaceae bacterium]
MLLTMEAVGAVQVKIPAGDVGVLEGILAVPAHARGVVIFAHGSGSSRLSPRNRFVAGALGAEGLATLLFDLLKDDEAADRANVFDIPLLAARVEAAIDWAGGRPDIAALPLGLFGASTGAAAALVAAAHRPAEVQAVVSRGGRPDLAGTALGAVRAATLLLVGGEDRGVIELNEAAYAELRCTARIRLIPGATHLFEEPGTLEEVVRHAAAWFRANLGPPGAAR